MKNIMITVESGSDMPKDMAQHYGIYVVPMHIIFGSNTKDDGSFPVSEICDFYAATGEIPKTSGSTPGDFTAVFEQIRKECPGKPILHLAYSAVTTCSYQSAVLAAEGFDDIACVDTKQAALGQTAAAIRVAQEIEKNPGWSLDEAAEFARKDVDRVEMCFVPKDLAYLRAGGRLGNAAALAGSILHIHPVIGLKDGYLVAEKKLRGRMQRIIPELMEEFAASGNLDKKAVWLEYSIGLSDEIRKIAEKTAFKLGFQRIYWISAGGIITTHAGPGAFGMAGYAAAS